MNSLISLKTSCGNRFMTQVHPSFPQKSFLMSNFSSPDFVDTLLSPYDAHLNKQARFNYNHLTSLICTAEKAFEATKDRNNRLETRFLYELTAFCTKDDDSRQEELGLIRFEMKRCHKNILKGLLDPVVVEDFALLLKEYETTKKRIGTNNMEDRLLKATTELESLKASSKTSKSWSEEDCNQVRIWETDLVTKSRLDRVPVPQRCKTKKVLTFDACLDHFSNLGTIIKFLDQEYALLRVKKQYISVPTKIVKVKNGRVLLSSNQTLKEIHVHIYQKSLVYADLLNMIVSKCTTFDGLLTLRLYRMSSKEIIRKVADILIEIFFPKCTNLDELYFDVVDPQHIVAITFCTQLKLVNILTRKTLKILSFDGKINELRYIRDLSFLVISLESRLLVYDLSRNLQLLNAKFSIDIEFIEGSYVPAINHIVFESTTSDIVRDENLIVVADYSTTDFFIIQINHSGINNYEIKVPNSQLYADVYNIGETSEESA